MRGTNSKGHASLMVVFEWSFDPVSDCAVRRYSIASNRCQEIHADRRRDEQARAESGSGASNTRQGALRIGYLLHKVHLP